MHSFSKLWNRIRGSIPEEFLPFAYIFVSSYGYISAWDLYQRGKKLEAVLDQYKQDAESDIAKSKHKWEIIVPPRIMTQNILWTEV